MIPLDDIKFTCQQSGKCCCNPNILVTLTYMDLSRLYRLFENDFHQTLRRITFYRFKKKDISPDLLKKVVLHPIHSSQGYIVPSLKKHENGVCTFYFKPNCSIHSDRPLACKNYPIAFDVKNDQLYCIWAKNAKSTCAGIGIGNLIPLNDLEKQGRYFLEETEKHNLIISEINHEESKGKPLSAREALWILIAYGEKQRKL